MKLNSLSFILSFSFAALVHCSISSSTFLLVAHAPGTPLDGKPVNANGLAFWIGKPTLTYCPASVLPPGACPPGNQTVLVIGSDETAPCPEDAICGGAGMSVEVPGGQHIYVDSSLAVRITQAHSGAQPAGSTFFNFSLTESGRFGWNAPDPDKARFSACPQFIGQQEDCDEVAYQIYGLKNEWIPRFGRNRCVNGITLTATPFDGFAAWEYT